MALWKPFRGNRADLKDVKKHDGYVYFCTDDGTLFFDYTDADGKLQRKQINAKEAEKILGYEISTALSSTSGDKEIPTSKAAFDAINDKVDKVDGKGLSTNDYTDEDKDKLGKIEAEANKTVVDSALSDTSTNPVQNKVVKVALDAKADSTHTHKYPYGVCETAGDVAAKEVDIDNFTLEDGAHISVYFHNQFQASQDGSNITLNVSNTGAKDILLFDESIHFTLSDIEWAFDGIYDFVYDADALGEDCGAWRIASAGYAIESSHAMQAYEADRAKVAASLYYGVCETGSDVAEKVVSVSNFGGLEDGIRISVDFRNDFGDEDTDIELNVNGTGAKPLIWIDDCVHCNLHELSSFGSGVYDVIYRADIWNGGAWVLVSSVYAAQAGYADQAGYAHSSNLANRAYGLSYGVCQTAGNVAIKSVTISGGFSYIEGARILVQFTNSNTATGVKLTVNSAPAYLIYDHEDELSDPTELVEGTYEFVYHTSPSRWELIGRRAAEARHADYATIATSGYYGVCETDPYEYEKIVSIPNFKLVDGARVLIHFEEDNTSTQVALNVSDTGAKWIIPQEAELDLIAGTHEFVYRAEQDRWEVLDSYYTCRAKHADFASNAATADSATKATQDGDGNNIASTYLKKTGGTITGNIAATGNATITGNISGNYVSGAWLQSTAGNALPANRLPVQKICVQDAEGWIYSRTTAQIKNDLGIVQNLKDGPNYGLIQLGYNADAESKGVNTSTGLNAITLGDSNTNRAMSALVAGSCNKNDYDGGYSFVTGCWNENYRPNSVVGGYWSINEGRNSLVLGYRNHNTGHAGVALGYNNQVKGDFSTALGANHEIKSTSALATGDHNLLEENAHGALVNGKDNYANHRNVLVSGEGLHSNTNGGAIFGAFNTYNDPDALLVVGNGTSDTARSNALTVTKDGEVIADKFVGELSGSLELKGSAGSSGQSTDLIWHVYDWEVKKTNGIVDGTYNIVDIYHNFSGILSVHCVVGGSATAPTLGHCSVTWIAAAGTPPPAYLTYTINDSSTTFSLYIKYPGAWSNLKMAVISADDDWGTFVDAQVLSMVGEKCSTSDAIVVESAKKLQTPRSIYLNGGAGSNIIQFDGTGHAPITVTEVKESFLTWGGQNLSGRVSPIDAAMSDAHSANRLAFANPDGIIVEYSTDGTTYLPYDTTDEAKVAMVSSIPNKYDVGARMGGNSVNDKLRITLKATDMGVYCQPKKLLMYVTSSTGTSTVTVEYSTQGDPNNFTTLGTYPVTGWSGWNSIPVVLPTFGGYSHQPTNIGTIRLTFGIAEINADANFAFRLNNLILLADTAWDTNSPMATHGHLYDWDANQNALFPARVEATTIKGTTFNGEGVATATEVTAYLGIQKKG